MDTLDSEMDRRIGTRLKRAEQVLIAEKTLALKPFDLTVPQYATLLFLSHVPTASAAQMARASMVAPQTMATVLRNLETKGLVRRSPSPLHQKVMATELTAAGRRLFDEADVAARAVEDRMLAALSAEQVETLKTLLDAAMDALVTAAPAAPASPAAHGPA